MTSSDDRTPEQFERASIQELAAGRLPLRAQRRLATMRADQAFTSNLTVAEHHAIRSVGFSPVGQVLGSSVYQTGYFGQWDCGYRDSPVEAGSIRQAFYEARVRAVERMRQECAGLGGDGVIAVRLTTGSFGDGSERSEDVLEFRAIGTAVRADGGVRPPQPFLSDLTGQDFAKLMSSGWVPCGLVLGLGVVIRHDDYRTQAQARSWRNVEMDGYTSLVHAARRLARDRLRADCVGLGGGGVVVRTMNLRVDELRCVRGRNEQRDHLVEALAIGTAITPFRHAGGNVPHPPLPIMRLD
ncbi:heavy metal-binding domain-containing protein [Solihabitans fulvus]|uniref:Heavy metal-binding domain-containing protein n=1 Tax=Solihabitans fulvus TaxID=1892852 RepID=A0A5B2XK24_9PSEU|nr:heavy metal-binding domain-containing protein [Solihabitans fulvus]KAA2264218.1 heavy metal-binding domain-containing protein [Solihabitans fulvus]